MRNLIRSPLTWMVAAELVVVCGLVAVAWNVVASAARQPGPAASALSQAPDAASDSPSPLPELPHLDGSPPRGPLPGLNLDPSFWHDRLQRLNADQDYLERLEWAIVHSAEQAVQGYLETVVLPAIQRAERAGGVVFV